MKRKEELASLLGLLSHTCFTDFLACGCENNLKITIEQIYYEIQLEYQFILRDVPVQTENAGFLETGNSYLPACSSVLTVMCFQPIRANRLCKTQGLIILRAQHSADYYVATQLVYNYF